MALCSGSSSVRKQRQQEMLVSIVGKHIQNASLSELNLAPTSTGRGIERWEHSHLAAALDIVNAYLDRLLQASGCGFLPGFQRSLADDVRVHVCELLKGWLRSHAAAVDLCEAEVRGVCSFCRELLNYPDLFEGSMRSSGFANTMAEVHNHLRWQLEKVLERDRSCAELAQQVLSLSRNLVSDVITFLMLAPMNLQNTDALPSLEVVSLWQSLPDKEYRVPVQRNVQLQQAMHQDWQTVCGRLVSAMLGSPGCLRLFRAEMDGPGCDQPLTARLEEASASFSRGRYKHSALVGALRGNSKAAEREDLFQSVLLTSDLTFLLGEVMMQFLQVGAGLGDYGMIRVSSWLHPFLEVLMKKLQRLTMHLERISSSLDKTYVVGRARGLSVEKPAPSSKMQTRSFAALERVMAGPTSHLSQLMQQLEALRNQSAPDRLPHLVKHLGSGFAGLSEVLTSPEYHAHVGDTCCKLPPLECKSQPMLLGRCNTAMPFIEADK